MRVPCSILTLLALGLQLQVATSANLRLYGRDDSSIASSSSPSKAISSSTSSLSSRHSSTPAHTTASTTSHVLSSVSSAPTGSSMPSAFLDGPIGNSTANNGDPLPLTPKLTPGLGIAGFFLLVSGIVFCVVGIRSKWLYVSGSAAYLSSLAVIVLICYLMNPPVSAAVQGAYFIAAFFTAIIIGILALVFQEVTEGLGCLLGGFCLAMWFLVLKPDGLIGSQGGKAIFIGVMSAVAYAFSFSRYTRHYGLIFCTSFAGATITVLGIDCFARAGLKEFWLWLWELNNNAFPLNTNHYPQTRGIRVEIAGIALICCFGIISQLKLWKLVKERRKRREADRGRHEETLEQLDTDVGRRVQKESEQALVRWEAVYGNKSEKNGPAVSVKEMSSVTDTLELSNMSASGQTTAPTSWRGSAEHKAALEGNRDDDQIRHVADLPEGYMGAAGASGSQTASSEGRHGSYLNERASLRASMPPPPPMISLPFNPATGTLEESHREAEETAAAARPFNENTLPRKRSKRGSGLLGRTPSFRSARSSLSNKRQSASQEDLLVPHEDDRRSSVAATLDILDEDHLSLPSHSDHSDVNAEPGHGLVMNVRPATAEQHNAAEADRLFGDDPRILGFLTPTTGPRSASPSDSNSKRLSGVSIAEVEDEEEFRPPTAPKTTRSSSSAVGVESPSGDLNGQLPDKLSKIALSYRTNEWAKHLEVADAPEVEDIPEPESPGVQVDPTFAETVRKESAAKNLERSEPLPPAPANVQTDGVKAAIPPPLQRRQTEPDRSRLQGQAAMPATIAPRLSRNSSSMTVNSTPGLSKPAMRSDSDLLQTLHHAPSTASLTRKKAKRRSSGPMVSNMPLVDEEAAMPTPSTTLLTHRETLMNGRMSTMSFATPTANTISPPEPTLSRPTSRHLLTTAQDTDSMPLSQRAQHLKAQRRSSATQQQPQLQLQQHPIRTPSNPALPTFDSHQPTRGPLPIDPNRREAMLAHWRASLRTDERSARQVQDAADENRRMVMVGEKRAAEVARRQRETKERLVEGERDGVMRSGEMLGAHREAMRRLQAETRRRSGL